MNSLEKNPFDVLYELVGECETFEEQVERISVLLAEGGISEELNAILLAEALSMPILASQNVRLSEAVKALQATIESMSAEDIQPPTNILKFPNNIIN